MSLRLVNEKTLKPSVAYYWLNKLVTRTIFFLIPIMLWHFCLFLANRYIVHELPNVNRFVVLHFQNEYKSGTFLFWLFKYC